MNKMYQYFSDHRLPTEYPFKEAAKLYWHRVVVVCIATAIAMSGATLIVLTIVAFREGYGFFVVIVVILFIFSILDNGGTPSGGTPGGKQTPPTANATKMGSQPEQEHQLPASDPEEVLVPASRPKPRRKLLAIQIDPRTGEKTVVEVDEKD